MGLMQRQKGKRFERQIAALFRSHWPDAIVRRASQAERADNPDVFIEHGPALLSLLWLELQDARSPTPGAKLRQAEADVEAWEAHGPSERYPVVIWHRLGEQTVYVTTRLWVTTTLAVSVSYPGAGETELTMSLDAFLELLKHAIGVAERKAA